MKKYIKGSIPVQAMCTVSENVHRIAVEIKEESS